MVAARASDSKIEPQQLPSGYVKVAIGNGHLYLIYPLKMVIFLSYVSLPESN
jgi:hypothetical protein